MDEAITYPDVINVQRYPNGDILLTLGDKKSQKTKRFLINKEIAKKLAIAIMEDQKNYTNFLFN